MSEKMPVQMKDKILHATLTNGGVVIMASDMVNESGLTKGNAVSLMLNCSSEEEIKNCFSKLSQEGIARHPLELTFFGALLGGLTDKFGNNWLLNYTNSNS